MKDYTVLKEVVLGPQHSSTDKTCHHRDGQLLPSAAKLQIVQYKNEPGFYLIYLGKDGKEMTDTYHDSLEKAFKQAEFEYQVKSEEWKDAELRRSNMKNNFLKWGKGLLYTLLVAGATYAITVNINQNDNSVTKNQENKDVKNVENISQSNSGTINGAMVGKVEVNTHPIDLAEGDKESLLKLFPDKSTVIEIGYTAGNKGAQKLAISVRDFLMTKGYKNTEFSPGIQISSCAQYLCVIENSIWVN